MIVAIEHHVGVGVVERLPDRLQRCRTAVLARAEAWVMPVGQRTGRRVRSQVGAQPLFLD